MFNFGLPARAQIEFHVRKDLPMSRVLLASAALIVALASLAGCIDVADIPNLGGSSGYQRAIDQDVSTTFDEGPTARSGSPRSPAITPARWRDE
jgi:hypothetical protein